MFWILDDVQAFGAGAFDDYLLLTTGLNFTNLAWVVRIMPLMHFTGQNAEFEPLVLDVKEVQLFEKVTCLCKYLFTLAQLNYVNDSQGNFRYQGDFDYLDA